jgi:hypothetical protein
MKAEYAQWMMDWGLNESDRARLLLALRHSEARTAVAIVLAMLEPFMERKLLAQRQRVEALEQFAHAQIQAVSQQRRDYIEWLEAQFHALTADCPPCIAQSGEDAPV